MDGDCYNSSSVYWRYSRGWNSLLCRMMIFTTHARVVFVYHKPFVVDRAPSTVAAHSTLEWTGLLSDELDVSSRSFFSCSWGEYLFMCALSLLQLVLGSLRFWAPSDRSPIPNKSVYSGQERTASVLKLSVLWYIKRNQALFTALGFEPMTLQPSESYTFSFFIMHLSWPHLLYVRHVCSYFLHS